MNKFDIAKHWLKLWLELNTMIEEIEQPFPFWSRTRRQKVGRFLSISCRSSEIRFPEFNQKFDTLIQKRTEWY